MKAAVTWIAALYLLAGCAGAQAPPGGEFPGLEPYLGVYRGSFDSARTEDPADDLNHNPCQPSETDPCLTHHEPLTDVLLALRRGEDGRIRADFYHDRDDLAADRRLDLLGHGCGTRLGPVQSVQPLDDVPGGMVATLPLTTENRLCLGKLRPVSRHSVRLALRGGAEAAAGGSKSASTSLQVVIDKAVRDENYLYVVEDGVRRRVRIDLDNSIRDNHELRYRVCIEDDLGEYDRCVVTDREFESFVLPIPVPGGAAVSYTWWQELQPNLERTTGRYSVEQYIGRFEPAEGSRQER